jgi:subtilisin-like proprotein convertase family protein
VPAGLPLTAALANVAGGPVSDGTYGLDFALYADETGGAALWAEQNVAVAVKSGAFSYTLGSSKPLSAGLTSDYDGLWLGIKVGGEAELPRRPLGSVAYAMTAQVALDLKCSGCVGLAALDPAALKDYAKLNSLAKVATTGQFSDLQGGPDLSGYAKAANLAKVANSGAYADLTGAPELSAFAKLADLANYAKAADLGAYAKAADLGAYAKTADLGAYAKAADLGAYAKAADLGAYAKAADLGAYAKAADLGAYAKAADLGAYAKTADLGAYAKTADLANVATTGAYGDLSGLPVLAKLGSACGTGLVVRGLNADGTLDCTALVSLPSDGLAKVSNGALTNVIPNTVAGTGPIVIKDNSPVGATQSVVVPDFGVAQTLAVNVDLVNSDISGLTLTLTDPNNVSYTLYEKGKAGAALKDAWPVPSKTVSGDLTTWYGKNPKGTWTLKVVDGAFLNNGNDGQVNAWSVVVNVLSSTSVKVAGDLVIGASSTTCNVYAKGAIRWSATLNRPEYCDGSAWTPVAPASLGSFERPAASCKAILDGGDSKGDGLYWLQPDATLPAFQTFCDMTTAGGGWTLVMSLVQGDYKLGGDDWNQKWQQSGFNRWADKSTFGDVFNATRYGVGDYKNAAYFSLKGADMLFYHVPDGTAVEQLRSASVYSYYTSSNFLPAKGPTVQGIFATTCPLVGGGGVKQCLQVPVTYATGNGTGFAAEQCPNNRAESSTGAVTFGAWNGEGVVFAFCPIKQTGWNAEHSCVGGNGATAGNGAGGWGNQREWVYDGNWCMSAKLRTAALMMLVR